jgi:wyosine [tRNA(Phe)-imidazoG37] synthetase (radical SAM superfamily)
MADPLPVFQDHRRDYAANRYAYPVVSRRSRGVSVGLNLNPDKRCNFDCVYCQVDRTTPGADPEVDLVVLERELDDLLDLVQRGELFVSDRFRATPPDLRRLNDIAFSGDGEPTSCPLFPEVVHLAVAVRQRHCLADVKLVLITNATLLHRPRILETLEVLAANQGEVWAKLDAGTQEYYQRVERTTIPLSRVVDNITRAAQLAPVVIQALFLRLDGAGPSVAEQEAFCARLNEIRQGGGRIDRVQVYTIARRPAEEWATALEDDELQALADRVDRLAGVKVECFSKG